MKKVFNLVLVLVCLITFSSCEFEKEYTVRSEVNSTAAVTVSVCEYNDKDERVKVNTIENPQKGQDYVFAAKPSVEKVKIYINDLNKWVQQVFYIEDGTEIVITGETLVGYSEP